VKLEEKLDEVVKQYQELNKKLSNPDILADREKYQQLAKTHAQLSPLVNAIEAWRNSAKEIAEAQEMANSEMDKEMQDFLYQELERLNKRKQKLEEDIRKLLIPKDPHDEKDIIVEIRAGAGGQEASLFAGDLYRMYSRYADSQKWKTEVISSSPSELGGFKEIVFAVKGRGAYSRLKFESGVHRVQRVPVTESGGRIHTSTATVAVLPEVEDIDVKIDQNDLRIDIFRSSGPGGQSVNTTDSAVRITHIPTGIVVSCQDEKSQLQNKEKALRVLRARLYDKLLAEQQDELASRRRLQIGTGDRSERIRTYNFPQGRVTDHRINYTAYNLDRVMEGEIDELIVALTQADQAEKLKEVV
jgi:peptide chain release factor 1